MQAKTKFPILIRFRDTIIGNGFVAHVLIDGRALLVTEAVDEHWVYGVQPGGVAGGASDAPTALNEFKTRYQSVLFDIASEAANFDEFKRNVAEFLECADSVDSVEWEQALQEVRRSNVKLDDLPTVRAETVPVKFQVDNVIQKLEPSFNQLAEMARAA